MFGRLRDADLPRRSRRHFKSGAKRAEKSVTRQSVWKSRLARDDTPENQLTGDDVQDMRWGAEPCREESVSDTDQRKML
jgi:hypothetical protein